MQNTMTCFLRYFRSKRPLGYIKLTAIFTALLAAISAAMLFTRPTAAEENAAQRCISVENYTMTVSDGADMTALRFAPGEYATAGEIKRAPGCITLDRGVIAAHLDASGALVYDLPNGGIYSVWCRYADGSERLSSRVDATRMTQEVEVAGATFRIRNLYGVADLHIAKGTFHTYREVKNNYFFGATSVKIGTRHDFTYGEQLPSAGDYTVCVRYLDATRPAECIHFCVDIVEPTVSVLSPRVVISGLEGVKAIRVVPGGYNAVGDIKRAAGCATYIPSTIDRLVDENGDFSLYLPEGGYTVAVQYANGYTHIERFDVASLPHGEMKKGSFCTSGGAGMNYLLYTPLDATEDMPLIVYLHGANVKPDKSLSVSDDLDRLMRYDGFVSYLASGMLGDVPAYVLMPHTRDCIASGEGIVELVRYIVGECGIDASRVGLTGCSLGGTGTWELASRYPDVFSAAVPVAGRVGDAAAPADVGDREKLISVASGLRDTRVLVIVGELDEVVDPRVSYSIYNTLKKYRSGAPLKMIIRPGHTHNEMASAYLSEREEILRMLTEY